MEKSIIKKIENCLINLNKIRLDKVYLDLIHDRLNLIKDIVSKDCFLNSTCQFQIILYCYSIIERLNEKYSNESLVFFDESLKTKIEDIRAYRNHIHLKTGEARPVDVDSSIDCLEQVILHYSSLPYNEIDKIKLIHSADLSNPSDLMFLQSEEIDINKIKNKYSKFITNQILILPDILIIEDKERKSAYSEYKSILSKIFTDQSDNEYSNYLIKGVLKSLKLFESDELKECIIAWAKKASFFERCGRNISAIVQKYPEEIIKYLESSDFYSLISEDTLGNSDWLLPLIKSLILISEDENIRKIVEIILRIYVKSHSHQVLDMAADMLWPYDPQTEASQEFQVKTINELYQSCHISEKIVNNLLINLIKGYKDSCTIYVDDNNQRIGIFKDRNNPWSYFQEIENQYETYLDIAIRKAKKDHSFLHVLLTSINLFEYDVVCKIVKCAISLKGHEKSTLNDLIQIKSSGILSGDILEELNLFLSRQIDDDQLNADIQIIECFNKNKTIDEDKLRYIIDNSFVKNLVYILENLDNQHAFGFEISKTGNADLKNKVDEQILYLIHRSNPLILSFLRGYFYNEDISSLVLKEKEQKTQVDLLLLKTIDNTIISLIKKLSRSSRRLYWINFNYHIFNTHLSEDETLYVLNNLIKANNLETALDFIEQLNINMVPKFLERKKGRAICLKILFAIANDKTLNICKHLDNRPNTLNDLILSVLDEFNAKFCSKSLSELEFVFADRGLEFDPKSIGLKLQKSPQILERILRYSRLIPLLNNYWKFPPGYNSNRFSRAKFDKWFSELEKMYPTFNTNDKSAVSLMLANVFSYTPFNKTLPLKKDIIAKLKQYKVDWGFYTSNYVSRLSKQFDINVDPNGYFNMVGAIKNNIKHLYKHNFYSIGKALEKELKFLLNR